ncbi:hypothetical protein [Gordonia sp. SMJS1]|uniref:hypothetical protein n=1 Tax=Gordonia sp. SMJS1 TaxID=3039400 RepID=UPI00245434CD|nr:hypothetical protein [Gordonia sp. SMJS1]WGJ88167.1 hypothetical protein QAD21_24120 [Gordonia sp. SMJS1]
MSLIGKSPAARRKAVKRQYMDDFTRTRRDQAYLRVKELDRQVREALNDEDQFERLYPLVNELKAAVADYERCVGRRIDFNASR